MVQLPDPVVGPDTGHQPEEQALLADSVGLALLVVLDTLSPHERLAFVLHDVFDLPFDEIAPMMDRTPAAARQLASRARRRIKGAGVPAPDPDVGASRPDYLAVHGAAWLVTRHYGELRPLMPSWSSTADGEYFGGPLRPAAGASRCDTSPAWLSWVGSEAAIALLSSLPAAAVERHCLSLAAAFRDGAQEAGARPVGVGAPSHIVTVRVGDPDSISTRLRGAGVRAPLLGDRLRAGFHYFNNEEDVATALSALRG